jgi:hypothetical protein
MLMRGGKHNAEMALFTKNNRKPLTHARNQVYKLAQVVCIGDLCIITLNLYSSVLLWSSIPQPPSSPWATTLPPSPALANASPTPLPTVLSCVRKLKPAPPAT